MIRLLVCVLPVAKVRVKLDFLVGPGMGGQQLTLDWLAAESFSILAKEVRGSASLASYKGSAKRSYDRGSGNPQM